MVTVRMNGKKEVLRLKIEPTALGAYQPATSSCSKT